jgi:Fe-S-cluster containining protein
MNMLLEYEKLLNKLNKKFDEYFNEQKEFIKCKAGCSLCCKNSYYPISEVEYNYIKVGIKKLLNDEQKDLIIKKTIKIIKQRKEFSKNNSNILDFSYECPFLVENSCIIYNYRALICRSHGLLSRDVENPNKTNTPYCLLMGYNYANIWEKESNTFFSHEKMLEIGLKTKPKVYNIAYSSLLKLDDTIKFGDIMMLAEWIFMDIPNRQELLK